jgi:hypothetical protein
MDENPYKAPQERGAVERPSELRQLIGEIPCVVAKCVIGVWIVCILMMLALLIAGRIWPPLFDMD